MSELNEFALKVASLLDTIADAAPETSSVPGAPYHLTLLESAKLAKAKHAAMRKQADPFTLGLGALGLGGLGALGMGAKKLWQGALPGIARRYELEGARLGGEALEAAAKHLGPQRAAEYATAGMAIKDPAGFQKWVRGLPGVKDLAKSEKLLKEQLALKDQEISDMWSKGLAGVGLGLGGFYAGHQMGKPDAPQQSNLPQIIRYG